MHVKNNNLANNNGLNDTPGKISSYADTVGVKLENLTRADVSVNQAIINTSNELLISKVILGWSGRSAEINKIFGNILDAILKGLNNEVVVCNLPNPLNTIDELRVFVPENAENETGFSNWIISLINLNRQLSSRLAYYSQKTTLSAIKEFMSSKNLYLNIKWHETNEIKDFITPYRSSKSIMCVFINSRPQYISFKLQLWKLTYFIPQHMKDKNFMIIYPCQG